MIKQLMIVIISLLPTVVNLLDSTMTIDSHSYHFVFDYLNAVSKSIDMAYTKKDSFDLIANLIDMFI